MEKTRVFKNDTKILQVVYDHMGNPHEVKPGQTYTEDLSGCVNAGELVREELARRDLATNTEEAARVKRVMGSIRYAKTIEDLEKLKEDEKNPLVLEALNKKIADLTPSPAAEK